MAERDEKLSVQSIKFQSTKFQTEFISEHKFSDWIHFRAQNFRLKSFQTTKFQTEIISEHKISDWNHFRAQNFRLKSFQSTKFQTEFQTEIISEHKISDWNHFRAQNFWLKSFQSTKVQTSLVWVNQVRRVNWHRDLGCSCQDHAAILGKYLLVRNFRTEQASNARPVSSMDKSGTASRLASWPWSYLSRSRRHFG